MERFFIWLVFVLVILVFSLWRPNAARIFLGFFFLAMAIGVNIVTVIVNPQSYLAMGSNALIPFYRSVFSNIIAINPVLFVLPVAAFQIACALLMLGKQKSVKLGLIGGILFLVAITPLGLESLPNLILAFAMALLLRHAFDKSFYEMLPEKLYPKMR